MSATRTFQFGTGSNLNTVIGIVKQNMTSQGYNVNVGMVSPVSAQITVSKGNDGITNLLGMGVECRVTISVMNANTISVNIDSDWTNKIICLAVGWLLCLIPLITGIIGSANQSGLPEKIFNAFTLACSGGFNQYNNNQGNPYNQNPQYNPGNFNGQYNNNVNNNNHN